MLLRCLSIGPRQGGRDYGILPRFREVPLPPRASGLIGDFATALLEWGLEHRPDFAAFFPLDPARTHHLLVKVGYLGRAALGPQVIANGLLLDGAQLGQVDGRPHRLLPAIRPPQQGEWDRLSMDLPPAVPGRAGTHPDLEAFGVKLQYSEDAVTVAVEAGISPEDAIVDILEAGFARSDSPLHWATTRELPRIERFDPAIFRLIVYPETAATPVAGGGYRLSRSGLAGPELRLSRALRLWSRFFDRTEMKAVPAAGSNAAKAIAQQPPWHRAAEEPKKVLADAMLAALDFGQLGKEGFWELLQLWAGIAAGLEGEAAQASQMAIAVAFRQFVEKTDNAEDQVALISGYRRLIWPRLPLGPQELPAGLAARLKLIARFSAEDLDWLIDHGLAGSFAGRLLETVHTFPLEDAHFANLAGALRRQLAAADPPRPSVGEVVQALAERALSGGMPAPLSPSTASSLLALSEATLAELPAGADARRLAGRMAGLLKLQPAADAATPLLAKARAALAAAFSPRPERPPRPAWVLVELLNIANERRAA